MRKAMRDGPSYSRRGFRDTFFVSWARATGGGAWPDISLYKSGVGSGWSAHHASGRCK